MRWLLIAVAVLATLVALVALLGALLPVAHAAARSIRLRQPPATVFAVIADPGTAPQWRSDLTSVEMLTPRDGRPCYREVSRFGAMDILVEHAEPPTKLVTRIVTDGSPFGGTWTYRLAPCDGGTELVITENGEVYNVFFRALSRFVFGHTKTMDGYLTALAAKFGEPVALRDAEPDPPLPPRPARR